MVQVDFNKNMKSTNPDEQLMIELQQKRCVCVSVFCLLVCCLFWVWLPVWGYRVIHTQTVANHRTALADEVSQKKKAAKEVGWSGCMTFLGVLASRCLCFFCYSLG